MCEVVWTGGLVLRRLAGGTEGHANGHFVRGDALEGAHGRGGRIRKGGVSVFLELAPARFCGRCRIVWRSRREGAVGKVRCVGGELRVFAGTAVVLLLLRGPEVDDGLFAGAGGGARAIGQRPGEVVGCARKGGLVGTEDVYAG